MIRSVQRCRRSRSADARDVPTHLFVWMGKVRELACQPVYAELARQFATGRWGMVSNYAETLFIGEARAEDVIEGRFFLGPASGTLGSTQDLHYEWLRLPPEGEPERFAWSRMGVTWVEILGHGIVEPRAFPAYYDELMVDMTPLDTPEVRAAVEPQPAPEDVDLGPELWSAPPGPAGGPTLHEETFDTSLDRPPAEAMQVQRIAVRMSLSTVHERGVRLRFDIFRLEGERRDKLGAGVHTAGWFAPVGGDGAWAPGPLPPVLRDALLARAHEPPSISR